MQLSAGGLGLVRIVLEGCGLRKQFVPDGDSPAGRPRASPEPAVLLGDRSAVPCRPVTSRSEVPRRTARSARLIAPASHAWFFRARPWLARTPVPTKAPAAGHAPYG
ncbi:hypothetical protein GCM10009601_27980 [Streptomyces thermospinosisporus]|uniref:Uncharacterized protein n=1 Tax=Streptomyces thermospinosisporus TaxID=161482 RepID=A0ABP4JK55_9ACTN